MGWDKYQGKELRRRFGYLIEENRLLKEEILKIKKFINMPIPPTKEEIELKEKQRLHLNINS